MSRYFGMRYPNCVVPGCTERHLGGMVFCLEHTVSFHVVSFLMGSSEWAHEAIYEWWKGTEGRLRAS